MKAFAQFFELTLSEKLQLVGNLWDNIASVPEQIPLLDWQKELDRITSSLSARA